MDWLLSVGFVAAISLLAIILLAWRDRRQFRRLESGRPIPERIRNIHADASFMIRELQRILERTSREPLRGVERIPPVLDYYRRLESLAADPDSSAEEALQLAEEASRYVKEHRLKGIFVAEQARKLADLLEMRDAA